MLQLKPELFLMADFDNNLSLVEEADLAKYKSLMVKSSVNLNEQVNAMKLVENAKIEQTEKQSTPQDVFISSSYLQTQKLPSN